MTEAREKLTETIDSLIKEKLTQMGKCRHYFDLYYYFLENGFKDIACLIDEVNISRIEYIKSIDSLIDKIRKHQGWL